jgi:hypothetical protein
MPTPKKPATPKNALSKPVQPDAALAAVVGKDPLPRTELIKIKRLWEYVRKHELQDPKDKRSIRADEKLLEQYRPESKSPDHPIQSRNAAALLRRASMGIDTVLGERPENCVQNDQCARRDGSYGTLVSAGIQETALHDPSRRFLRMEEGRRRRNPVFDRHHSSSQFWELDSH